MRNHSAAERRQRELKLQGMRLERERQRKWPAIIMALVAVGVLLYACHVLVIPLH